jgi:hypothetical protein
MFSGAIPTQVGRLVNLKDASLSKNNFTTTLPSEVGKLQNLKGLAISDIGLTGRLPQELGELRNLKFLDASQNALAGAIPSKIWNIPGVNRGSMDLLDNALVGTVPDKVCTTLDTFKIDLKVDCFKWLDDPQVSCDCCHSCDNPSMLFMSERSSAGAGTGDSGTADSGCPGDVIEIVGDYFNYWELLDVNTKQQRKTMTRIDKFQEDEGRNLRHSLCVSRASCFKLQLLKNPAMPQIFPFQILSNGKVVYEQNNPISAPQFEVPLIGYSEQGKDFLAEGKCDAFQLCGTALEKGTSKREIFNHIVELAEWNRGLIINNNNNNRKNSPQYQAACWLVTNGNQIQDLNLAVADGSAMQRYVLALLHFHNDAWKTKGPDDKFYGSLDVNLETCAWEGITCDDLGYVTEIDLSQDTVLNGLIPSELGYLTSLKVLRMNGEGRVEEKLRGSIPTQIGRLHALEELDLGDHEISGELHKELFAELTSIRRLMLFSNRLEGTLSPNVTLMASLGKSFNFNLSFERASCDFVFLSLRWM